MEIVVLAVTKMSDGFCIVGKNIQGRWLRLIPEGLFNWRSLNYENGEHIEVGDVLRVSGLWRHTPPPHFEDYTVQQFLRIKKLTNQQLLNFCRNHSETTDELLSTLSRETRSLTVLRVDNIDVVFEDADPVKSRLAVRVGDRMYRNDTRKPGFPCTCLKWRAVQRRKIPLPIFHDVYVVFGLARPFTDREGIYVLAAPMIISIISEPSLPILINYNKP